MIKKALTLTLIAFLFGCTQSYKVSFYSRKKPMMEGKSVIILHVKPSSISFDLVKFAGPVGSAYPDFITNNGFFGTAYRFKQSGWGGRSKPKVLVVDAGYYAITNIQSYSGDITIRTLSQSPVEQIVYHKAFIPTFGALYAPPGGVSYIGTLNFAFNHNFRELRLDYLSHPDYIQGYLEMHYPALAPQMKVGTLFPAGRVARFHDYRDIALQYDRPQTTSTFTLRKESKNDIHPPVSNTQQKQVDTVSADKLYEDLSKGFSSPPLNTGF